MLLSFQKPAAQALIEHFKTRQTVKFGELDIHPPAVISASVSAGKSIIISEVAKAVKEAALARDRPVSVIIMVIQRQGLLASQNSDAAWSIGLQNSIYSAACGKKSTSYQVVFATEGTLARALDTYRFSPWTEEELQKSPDWRARQGKCHPDLILIDEGHQVPFEDPETQYMKALLHFYKIKPHMRLAMMSGSPFRGSASVVGDSVHHLWKQIVSMEPDHPNYPEGGVGNGIISQEFMTEQGWIVPLIFGYPDEGDKHYDFSHITSQDWGYPEAELDAAVSDKELCLAICKDFIEKTRDRKGVLIFAATKRHTRQIAAALKLLGVDESQIGVITESTTQKEQTRILEAAKKGALKFVINVSVLTTGVNCSWWDTIVLMRPIASIVLLIQAIGRILRLLILDGEMGMVERDALTAEMRKLLIAASSKPNGLVLDYANVMDSLRALYDNPVLEQADMEKAKKEGLDMLVCQVCNTENSPHARRCRGVDHAGVRCDYFWVSRDCPSCGTKNDTVARECRSCRRLLIDPNAKLDNKVYTDSESVPVESMSIESGRGGKLIFNFTLRDGRKPQIIHWPHAGKQPALNSKIWAGFIGQFPLDQRTLFRFRAMKATTVVENAELIPVPVEMCARLNGKGRWNCGALKFLEVASEI